MLVREPTQRASLDAILQHPWIQGTEASASVASVSTPLVSRQHISDEVHNYIVQRMVDGKIAAREAILS